MNHSKVFEVRILRDDVLEQPAQFRNIPLAVAEIVHELPGRLDLLHLESVVERLVRHLDPERVIHDQQRLAYGLQNRFAVLLRESERAVQLAHLRVAVLQFLVHGGQFLIGGLQLFLRCFQLFVRALELLITRKNFLVR